MTKYVELFFFMPLLCYADNSSMKVFFFMTVLLSFSVWSASGVRGKVSSPKECSTSVMVWLSLDKDDYKERLLLMHTEVPVGGTFQFYLKPGDYQVRASDEKGCEFFKRIKVDKVVGQVDVQMERK